MKQIIQSFKTGELWLAEVPVPLCKKNGVLMQNQISFVSAGTERMLVDFAQKNIIGKALQMPDQVKKVLRKMKTEGIFNTWEKVKTKLDQPIPLGYSCAGIVLEVGSRVPGLQAGDRVACGGAGFANHAEFNYVPRNLVVKIPDSVSFEDASCATVGSIALQGVRQCDLKLGESACVIGLGLLGILAVQMLKAAGCKVIGFDPNPQRCTLAVSCGADLAVHANLADAALEFSDGYGVDAVLITAATKSDEPVTVAGEICRQKGKVVVTGLVGMDIPRDQYYKKELDFKLSLSYGPGRYDPVYEDNGIDYPYGLVRWTEQRNMKAFLDLVAMGKLAPGKLITHRFLFDEALQAYDLLLGKVTEPYLGIVLRYSEVIDRQPAATIQCNSPKTTVPEAPVIGFIGCGNFTKGVLLPALKKCDAVRWRGLCTASGMNCGETAQKEGFEIATTDVDAILKDEQINTVFITTRHDTHAEYVCRALQAGKHVFVEKPLAIHPEELTEIQTACANHPGRVMVGFNRRFSPHAVLLKKYFADRTSPMLISYRVNAGIVPKDSWLQDPDTGGGRLIGEGCHFIDFCTFLIGKKVTAVQAMCFGTANAAITAEDNISCNLLYEDGSVANLIYVAVGSGELAKERCEIHADSSSAIMDNFCLTTCSGKLGERRLKTSQQKGFVEELTHFLEAIRHDGPAPIPPQELFNTTEAAFAILRSLRSGTNIVLS